MIYFKKKFPKIFKNTTLIAGSCAISTLLTQVSTQAMIGRVLRPVVTTGSKIVSGGGVHRPRLNKEFYRGLHPSTTSMNGGPSVVRGLIDKFNGGLNSSGSGSGRPTFATSNPQTGGVKSLIDKFNGNGNTSVTSSSVRSSTTSTSSTSLFDTSNITTQNSVTTEDIVKTLTLINQTISNHSTNGLEGNINSIKLGLLGLQLAILGL